MFGFLLGGLLLGTGAEITRDAVLFPSEPEAFGNMGTDVSLFDDTLVVGNWIQEKVYIYRRDGGVWAEHQKFANTGSSMEFGNAVAVHGDWMAIGARLMTRYTNNSSGNKIGVLQAGAVNLYKRSAGGQWILDSELQSDVLATGGQFGTALSMSEDRLVVTQGQRPASGSSEGVAHIFRRVGPAAWVKEASAVVSNLDATDTFGFSVALAKSGDRLVVGATKESSNATGVNGPSNNNLALASGAAYVFRREVTSGATNWVQEAYLKASNTDPQDWFGYSVAMDETGETVVVGAINEDSNATGVNGGQGNGGQPTPLAVDRGAAYVFSRTPNSTQWSQVAYLKPFQIATNSSALDYFGWSTAISGDTILVGAYNGPRDSAYVFSRSNGVWATRQRLTNSGPASVGFGYAVALQGNVAGITAVRESTTANRAGAAFIYSGFLGGVPLPNPTIVYPDAQGGAVVTFYGSVGQAYLLQRSASLANPGWLTVQSGNIGGDGKVMYMEVVPPAAGAFYRIKAP